MKISLHQIRKFSLILLLVLISGASGWWLAKNEEKLFLIRKNPSKEIKETFNNPRNLDFSLFWQVWDQLEKSYIDKKALDSQKMFLGAIKGMVEAVGDPYTFFLSPEENKENKDDLSGEFEGIGVQLGYKDHQLAVIAPLKGTPAEKAGIKAGDLILKIGDQDASEVTLYQAVKMIRGPKGTKIKLTLLRPSETEPYEVVIERDKILVPSVELEFVKKEGKEIAYLKLSRFGEKTEEEWQKAVDQIVNHQPRVEGLILDLRNNPGGYLTGSIFIASEFLKKGVIVQQESGKGVKETYSVNRKGRLTEIKMVVLVNEGSASASEIVAGALKDYQRAKIIGEKTFGKGTIQEAQDFPDGSGLHVTTARWLLPSGNSIEKNGITPDIIIEDDSDTPIDEPLEKAKEVVLKF
ncbi:MAG: S41 family peptidase [Microgenomates group bacterium]